MSKQHTRCSNRCMYNVNDGTASTQDLSVINIINYIPNTSARPGQIDSTNLHISEVSSSAVVTICKVSSSAVQLVLLTTHGTASEITWEISSSAVKLVRLTENL